MVAAVGLVGGSLGLAFWWASREKPIEAEEEIVDAEVQNFEIEEEPEEEIEEEPEPEPPSPEPSPTRSKPQKQPEIQQPVQADATPTEGPVNTEGTTGGGGGGTGKGGGGGEKKPTPPPAEKPVEKPKKKQPDTGLGRKDTEPGSIPDEATPPKKIGGDPIAYPEELRKRNVTGKIKVKLTIYKDGSVKGAKILAKENSVDPAEDPELHELANKLFVKALTKALPTWKYSPCEYQNKPITVYLTVTVPFTLD